MSVTEHDDPPHGDPAPTTGTDTPPVAVTVTENPPPGPARDPDGWDRFAALFGGRTAEDVAKALEESRKWERRAKENAPKARRLDELEAEKMTVEQRLTAERDTAATERDDYRAKYLRLVTEQAATDAARQAGAVSPRAVYALIRDDLEVADDGTVSGVEAAIRKLARTDPDLFRPGTPGTTDAGAGRTPRQPLALNGDPLERSLRAALGSPREQ